MWDNTLILGIISSLVALIGGGGGLLAFLNTRQKNAHEERSSSVLEWKQLYDEMKQRLDSQEEENNKLRQELTELQSQMINLQGELDKYKRYDNYVYELEAYIDILLRTVQTLTSEESFQVLLSRRPIRPVQIFERDPQKEVEDNG